MQIYVLQLLLEHARVTSDERGQLGFVCRFEMRSPQGLKVFDMLELANDPHCELDAVLLLNK